MFEVNRGGVLVDYYKKHSRGMFKGLYRYYYYYYMLYAPSNNRGQPVAPTHQLCATWVVKAWNKVSEELVRKS